MSHLSTIYDDHTSAKLAAKKTDETVDPLSQDDKHMAARAVASSRVDKFLGTDVLTDERFVQKDGKTGVMSMRAAGEALRTDTEIAPYEYDKGYLDVDMSAPEFQKSMNQLQINDYITGQADRHAGNIFYDHKTGRVRGIDNDMAFGDKFNDFMDEDSRIRGAKSVFELPRMMDKDTAQKIIDADLLEFYEILGGQQGDFQHLTEKEKMGAFDRMVRLQDHAEKLMAKYNGDESVEVEGEIVDEWNDETYAKQMEQTYTRAGEQNSSSYLRRDQNQLTWAKEGMRNKHVRKVKK